MTGFTRTTDENNNISEYMSYSSIDGYTVLKSGWYYINLYAYIGSSGASTAIVLDFYANGKLVSEAYSWSRDNAYADVNRDGFSIYLSEGDRVYFSAKSSGSSATTRKVTGTLYPMF